ncbi:MAG: ATP-binding protein [Spirulinaceae cyanobacterium RM2_2_10]|nr:ATP-binding protein [Spirulinaceae cyanobacterium SM2_1_0]NJO21419.1 ATP-binding protein [Spirulinaceae cyanobacterium RM2_2_10]
MSLEVSTTLEVLDQVLAWFEQIHHPTIQQKDWLQCQLALAEAFTNAVRHAHRDLPPTTPITLAAALHPGVLELRIWDCGPPFDLTTYLDTNATSLQRHQAGGGRGLAILTKIADRLSYDRTADERNCLVLFKKYQPIGEQEPTGYDPPTEA